MDEDGVGLGADAAGHRWHIRGAVPGSTVGAVGRRSDAYAKVLLEPHADAIPAPCPHFGTCGGCQWQSLPLARQREEKLAALRRLYAPLGVDGAIVGEGDGYGYRDKIELSFGTRRWVDAGDEAMSRDGRFVGFHSPRRFDRIVPVDACAIAHPALGPVLRRAAPALGASPLSFWDADAHAGFLRHLVLRAHEDGVLVTIVTSPPEGDEADWLRAAAPGWGADGVRWVTTDSRADVAVGELREVLHGQTALRLRFGERDFHLAPDAFFQVNRPGAAVLLDVVRGAVGTGGRLLDLYCGVGAFAGALRGRFAEVIGVELYAPAVEDARRNVPDAAFHVGEVEAVVPALGLDRADVVLVDPPRPGLHPRARKWLAGFDAGRIVYVACKPASFLRDAQELAAAGWRVEGWTAVDLFPQTRHVEVVAWLRR